MKYSQIENEARLVKNLSEGNLLAFNSFFKAYGNRLYRFALGYLKSEEEAEELVQEVFTVVWEKRENLKEELSFKSYLFTIAFNIIRKHFRTKAQLSEYLKAGTIDELDTNTTEKITFDSLFQYVNELVSKLPERRRLIFIKSRFEGLSVKEIAEELNISHKTVENQLTDALKFIRTNLNKKEISAILFFVLFISK
ncbi:MAG: RNA polymerase sigma-70 factor [Bacteroidales bacterium]|nr:RNA polymerase sigma-70 factor [Bacteroidales bacterium]MBK7628605.1 RNA polymerase sigma-70 factor [Bacteroidales bacterium]